MPNKSQQQLASVIEKIKLCNFKRFPSFEARFAPDLNILIGGNESGKSTILLALDIVLGGSRAKVEAIGLESLFNNDVVNRFLASERRLQDLPELFVEVYLAERHEPDLNGINNSERRACDGLRFSCEPDPLLFDDIKETLRRDGASSFPYEFYEVRFFSFSGKAYAGYNRPVRHVLLDSAQVNSEHALRTYVRDLYGTNLEGDSERHRYENEYRRHKEKYEKDVLAKLNDRLAGFEFALRTTGKDTLESDLTITENGVPIENKGKGRQSFIKTEFALRKTTGKVNIDILLLEEPENHLSHLTMKRLIHRIRESVGKQLIIATHSNLISARLDLRKCLLLSTVSTEVVTLSALSDETAEFFMKAPGGHVLEFILSRRVILVEGDAEYILAEEFFKTTAGASPETSEVHIIAVGGTSFKRYMELARLLGIKTAVVRDNDGNFAQTCIERYAEHSSDTVRVFFDDDDRRQTFEICLYEENRERCDELFLDARRTLSVQDYMLSNKTECVFELLQHGAASLQPPPYFANAIAWIRE